jgi:hypothetical protein
MSDAQTFIDLCVDGKVSLDGIDDFVDQWHETPAGMELHDYLGMTQEEYSLWLRVPDALSHILKARQEGKSLTEIIANEYQIVRLAPQNDKLKITHLRKWLKEKGELI